MFYEADGPIALLGCNLLIQILPHFEKNKDDICDRLEEAGYKTQSSEKFKINNYLPTEALVKIVNLGVEQHTISIDINIKL